MTPDASARPLQIAVTGASGLVGGRLAAALAAKGHSVVALTRARDRDGRSEGRVRWAAWEPTDPASAARAVAGCDAVVHLAGEGLFGRRWNDAVRAEIRRSRVDATRALVDGIASLRDGRPTALVSASAVGYYGPLDPDATVDESAPAGSDFLAGVCRDWEAQATRAREHGVRVAVARIGIVLAREGGALRKMWLPFKLGLGGPIGRGRQVMSWVHADDLVALLAAMAEDGRWSGPFNAVAPFPVTSREFARALGRALHRPAFLPVPPFALRLLFGPVASILTTGQRVLPLAAQRLGFEWRHATLDSALEAVARGS